MPKCSYHPQTKIFTHRAASLVNTVWLSREKTLNPQILWFSGYSWKFLLEIWGHGICWYGKSKQFVKVFFTKIVFFTNSQKFSPSNVFHYTIKSGHIHWENWGLIIKTCHCTNQIPLLSKLHLLTSDNKLKPTITDWGRSTGPSFPCEPIFWQGHRAHMKTLVCGRD